jgi:hypothetical protein
MPARARCATLGDANAPTGKGAVGYEFIEQNRDLGRDGIDRQLTEVAHEAQKKLANFRQFVIAEQAATKEIDMLDKREGLTPQEAQAKRSTAPQGFSGVKRGRAPTHKTEMANPPPLGNMLVRT